MSIKIISIKENPQFEQKAKEYCHFMWNKVSNAFNKVLEESLATEQSLPQTFLLLGGMGTDEIKGFYQICERDHILDMDDMGPWVASLFVDPSWRGWFHGAETFLNHAKYEVGKMGFDYVYIATDHISFYEKYDFKEIGLAMDEWGQPAKVYKADAYGKLSFRLFDNTNSMDDNTSLQVAKYTGKWNGVDNPALILQWMKYMAPPVTMSQNNKYFTIICYKENEVIGQVNFIQNSQNLRNWYLGDLSVSEKYRRQHIGAKLVERGLAQLRSVASGGESVYAYIENDNQASIMLHKKLGFADTGKCIGFEDFIFCAGETTYELIL